MISTEVKQLLSPYYRTVVPAVETSRYVQKKSVKCVQFKAQVSWKMFIIWQQWRQPEDKNSIMMSVTKAASAAFKDQQEYVHYYRKEQNDSERSVWRKESYLRGQAGSAVNCMLSFHFLYSYITEK